MSLSYNALWSVGVEGFHLPLSGIVVHCAGIIIAEQRLLIKLVLKHGFVFFSLTLVCKIVK